MLCEVFFSSFPGDTNACMRMFPALANSLFSPGVATINVQARQNYFYDTSGNIVKSIMIKYR